MPSVAADTHAALWFLENDSRLSPTAAQAMENAQRILLPSVCLVEITYLVEKGRIHAASLTRLLTSLNMDETTLDLAPLDLGVVLALQKIARSDVPDMPDRIIAATASFHCVPLVTRDRQIRSCGIETIW
jgi:PIN domain nuclease of toxin-antitoxin system